MRPRVWLMSMAVVWILPGVAAAPRSDAAVAPRPNILFILSDDHGPWAFGAAGNPEAFTPNLDRLARAGARFENAFAPTPVCSPARANVLVSRYGSEVGITDWINPAVDGGLGLDPALPTWPRLLRQAGYVTALVGKWHLGSREEQHPTRLGYEHFVGFRTGGAPARDPELESNGVVARREGFTVDLVAEEAIAWLRRRGDGAAPFALSVHFREPHAAYLPVRDEDWARVKDLDPVVPDGDMPGLYVARVKKTSREYLASVAALDRNVGRLLETLDALRLATNTLVIYTSDHGYNLGHHGLLYKGNAQWMRPKEAWPAGSTNVPAGQRPNLFDTSLRVPMLVRWPGVIAAGSVERRTISHLDWLPTFAALAGIGLPAGTVVRGRSLVPLLRGAAPGWDNDLYAEYSMRHGARVHLRAWRTPEWKLVRDFLNPGRDELYHLASDPGERRNRIVDPDPAVRRVVADLDTRIRARMRDLRDPVFGLGGDGGGRR